MTNKEKLIETFGVGGVMTHCTCTFDKVQERCVSNGQCLGCKMWLDAEYKEANINNHNEEEGK